MLIRVNIPELTHRYWAGIHGDSKRNTRETHSKWKSETTIYNS